MAYLNVNETFTKVLIKFAYFAYVFSPKLVAELFKHTGINNHVIKFINNKNLYIALSIA